MNDARLLFLALSLLGAGCGGGATTSSDDAGTTPLGDAATVADAALAPDGALPPADGGTAACMPTGGSEVVDVGCDLLEIAVLTHDDAAPEVLIQGRVSLFGLGADRCGVIDGIDVVEGAAGSTVVQHFEGGASVALDSAIHPLGRATPTTALTDVCATDDPDRRFDSFGVVIRGRVDGGTFEAHCARAEGGSRWPPALRVTCHHGVTAIPSEASATVSRSSFMGTEFVSTTLYSAIAHAPGAALTSIDATIHVIPRRSYFDPGAPLAPEDTTGWMGSANESGETPSRSQLQAFADHAPLPDALCPVPMAPGPDYVPPPVFLARLTGQSEAGAYTTEVYVNSCYPSTTP